MTMPAETDTSSPKYLRDKYAIVGVGETKYTRGSGVTTRALGTTAVRNAIEDAGLKPSDVDGMLSYQSGDSTFSTFVAGDLGIRPNFYMDVFGGGSSTEALVGMAMGLMEAGMCKAVVIFRAMNGFSQVRIGGTGARAVAPVSGDMLHARAYGWQVIANVDGHDVDAVDRALRKAKREKSKPTLICAKTVIGKGAPTRQNTGGAHGAPLGDKEIAATREAIGWPHAPFMVPQPVLDAWNAKRRGAAAERKWKKLVAAYGQAHPELAAEFLRRAAGRLPADFAARAHALLHETDAKAETVATRKASQRFFTSSVYHWRMLPFSESIEMPLSSYTATSLPSPSVPASAQDSCDTPSIRQPSPRNA